MTQAALDQSVQPGDQAPATRPSESPSPASREPVKPDIVRVTLAVKIAVGAVTPMVGFLAVLGAVGSFTSVRHLATPWFGDSAWIVPVGVDVGILALLSWDLITEYVGFPSPMLRWTAWAFIGATVYLNVAAAHGNLTAAVMHAAMPVLFVSMTEGIRHLIRQLTGLATGTRIERIPPSRWLYAPIPTFLLKRRMVLWQVTSYRLALVLEHRRLQAVARLQESYGQYLWRWRAPLADRLALRLMPAGLSVGATESLSSLDEADGAPGTAPDHPEQEPTLSHFLPRHCLIEPPKPPETPVDPEDQVLITAAAEILRDAERGDTRITQGALAKLLRQSGYRVANDRLSWLMTAAQQAAVPRTASPENPADGAAV